MEFDDIYKYVGIFMVGLIVFWLALKSIRFQYKCVEGFIGKKTTNDTTRRSEAVATNDTTNQ